VTTEGCVGLERPLVAGSWCYMLTFPAPADILLTGANSGKLEERERERGFKIDLYLHDLTQTTQDVMGKFHFRQGVEL